MLTVPEAARRTHKDPETIRRWIRAGKLSARKVGTQHVIDEDDLDQLTGSSTVGLPPEWTATSTGEPMPDVVATLRESRAGR